MRTESVQANAVRLLTIATLVIGFGLFDASFQQDIKALLDPFERRLVRGIAFLKIYVGAVSAALYLVTFLRVGVLLVHDNLRSDALVRRRGPFWPLFTLVWLVIVLFAAEQWAGAAGLQLD